MSPDPAQSQQELGAALQVMRVSAVPAGEDGAGKLWGPGFERMGDIVDSSPQCECLHFPARIQTLKLAHPSFRLRHRGNSYASPGAPEPVAFAFCGD